MTCPDCGDGMGGVQYALTSQDYDGVSEWYCSRCRIRLGRWSGLRLKEGEIERRHGGTPVQVDHALNDKEPQ